MVIRARGTVEGKGYEELLSIIHRWRVRFHRERRRLRTRCRRLRRDKREAVDAPLAMQLKQGVVIEGDYYYHHADRHCPACEQGTRCWDGKQYRCVNPSCGHEG